MSKPAAKAASKKATGPSYESMIKEAIIAHPAEARAGLSRPTIKKFIQQKHSATSKIPEASFNNHISKAIVKGAEKKIFSLPKGPSGKVKLAATVKKAAVKKPAAAKKPAAKKPAAKKPAAKKVVKKATTAKKPAAKKTKSSTATKAKKPVAKKTATKKAAPKKAAAAKKA